MTYEDSFIVNRFIDGITPIRISLPKPPRKEFIAGSERKKEDQYFRLEKYPEKLKQLENNVRKSVDGEIRKVTEQYIILKFWEEIEKNPEYYENELTWIKKQWYYRLFGYWFMNNGVATYIDGWHWYYLNYWYMGETKTHHPEFRERDREQFLFFRYCYTTQETFKNIDPLTLQAIPNDKGEFEVYDLGTRTILFVVQPKNRRGGNTNSAFCMEWDILTTFRGVVHGLNQSFNQGQIDKTWEIMRISFKYTPFFFKPQWQGAEVPDKQISFNSDKIRNPLGTVISMATEGGEDYGKGTTALFRLYDESGESQNIDQSARLDEGITTLSEGAGALFKGFGYLPSTISASYGDAAKQYLSIYEESDFYKRGELSGQTPTKGVGLLFPAWYCMAGFIGKYGESIHDTPTDQQRIEGFGKPYGSKEYLQREKDELLAKNTEDSLKKYRLFRKKWPITLEDLYIESEISKLDFNYESLDERKFVITHSNPPLTFNADLRWENDIKDTNVVIIPRPDGRFTFSKQFDPKEYNDKIQTRIKDVKTGRMINTYRPKDLYKGIVGVDPYQTINLSEADLKKKKRLLSDGGIVARPRNERIITDYLYRPSLLDNNLSIIDTQLKQGYYSFCEDVLMLCVLLGYRVFPENNVNIIDDYFTKRGYVGFLIYDKEGDKFKDKPGIFSNQYTKETLFEANKQYSLEFINVECHVNIIEQMQEIKSMKDMTNHDLFTAEACANVGNNVLNEQIPKEKTHFQGNKLQGWIKTHRFKK